MLLTSPYPDVPLYHRSIFTHILDISPDTPDLIGGFPGVAPAFIDEPTGTVISRAALRSYALQFAHSLHDLPAPLVHSSSPHILIFSQNNIAWSILLYGIAAAGFCATLANSSYTSTELALQYVNAAAHLVFVHPSLLHVVQSALRSLGCTESDIHARIVLITSQWLTGAPDSLSTEQARFTPLDAFMGRGTLPHEVQLTGERANDTLILCYSSGTTGKPKGVETTHYNIISLIEILKPAWPSTVPSLAPTLPAGTSPSHPDIFLGPLPFYHIYGLVKSLFFPLSLGTPSIIMTGFDPARFCAAIERYSATILLIVPPMLLVLTRHDALQKHNMTSIRTIFSGAAPLSSNLVDAIRNRLQKLGANAVVTQAYGLTETSPTLVLLHPDDASTHTGSVGRVLPNIEAQLVREDAGEVITNIDNAGELWVRGPTVMKGYWNNPSATAAAITPDGWFKTGDIAISDADGFLTIIDRRKELIKYKGFQVAPAELEALLLQHADVADAAVVSVNSQEEATELPRAYVVSVQPIPSLEVAAFALSVQSWVAARVAPHKKLRGGIVVVDQIPKSASGKILRRELRERGKGEVGHGQVVPHAKL